MAENVDLSLSKVPHKASAARVLLYSLAWLIL